MTQTQDLNPATQKCSLEARLRRRRDFRLRQRGPSSIPFNELTGQSLY